MKRFSTENIRTRFEQHGLVSYEFTAETGVLYTYGSGPFNKETMEAIASMFLDSIAPKVCEYGKPYIEILFCHGSAMATPDAFEEHVRFLKLRKSKNLQPVETIAVLVDIEEGLSLIESLWTESFEKHSHKITFFDSREKASNYLNELLESR